MTRVTTGQGDFDIVVDQSGQDDEDYQGALGCTELYCTVLWAIVGCSRLYRAVLGCSGMGLAGLYWATLDCIGMLWALLG